eukprot:626021-Rhodomonas_salina.1
MAGESCSSVGLRTKKEKEYNALACRMRPSHILTSTEYVSSSHTADEFSPCGEHKIALASKPIPPSKSKRVLIDDVAFNNPLNERLDDCQGSSEKKSMLGDRTTDSLLSIPANGLD